MLLIGEDTLKVLEARFDLKNNIGIFQMLETMRGKELRVHCCLFRLGSFMFVCPIEDCGTPGCLVNRLPGSRTIRDLVITSGRGSFQRLHRSFRRLRQERATPNEHDFQLEEERMESDVMDDEVSLHQEPRDVCGTEDVMGAEGSLHQKPRDVCAIEVMDDKGSLHQKSNEVCITEDAESIGLRWFENTKLNRVKMVLDACCRWTFAIGNHLAHLRQDVFLKGFCETVAEVMDAEVEGEDEIHPSKRPRVAERVATHDPSEVEPQNRRF